MSKKKERRVKKRYGKFTFCIICFIFVVSYKIMEPELTKTLVDSDYPWHSEAVEQILEKNLEYVDYGKLGLPLDKLTRERYMNEHLEKLLINFDYEETKPWQAADNYVMRFGILSSDPPELGSILTAMAARRILTAGVTGDPAQNNLRLTLYLEGDQRATFKPMWYEDKNREFSFIEGNDRHFGELAAFHIARIFEFNRSPYVAGRVLDLRNEVLPVLSPRSQAFFNASKTDICLVECTDCDMDWLCNHGDMLEGVVILALKDHNKIHRRLNPWRYPLKKPFPPPWWKMDAEYCSKIMSQEPFKEGRILLDIIDQAILNYLILNMNQHFIFTIEDTKESAVLLTDMGKSFGKHTEDELTILAPLYQCCKVRKKTWEKVQSLQDHVFSTILRQITSFDSISPVLTPEHYIALDRRIKHVLIQIHICINKFGQDGVIIPWDYL